MSLPQKPEQERVTNTKAALLHALKRNMGIISHACKEVGLASNQPYYRYIRDDEDFKRACIEIQEAQIDFVESQLLQKIKEGNPQCIMFYLRTKGKGRGYTEGVTIETVNKEEEPIKVIFVNGTESH